MSRSTFSARSRGLFGLLGLLAKALLLCVSAACMSSTALAQAPAVAPSEPEAPADSANVQPAQVEAAQVEAAQVQPVQVEAAQVQPAQVQPAQVQPAQVQPAQVQVDVLAGFGFGTRAFERPTATGVQELETVPFAAADIALRVLAWPTACYSLEFLVRHQTSLGMVVQDQPLFALPSDVSVRVSRTELSVAPTFRLWRNAAGAESSPRIALPVGLMLRSFWPETHVLGSPGFSLLGPHLRAELIAPLGRSFTLRLGPEAHWILVMDRTLRRDGIHGQGLGVGAEASLALDLAQHFGLELSYRQSHAIAEGRSARIDFADTERFATLRLVGRY